MYKKINNVIIQKVNIVPGNKIYPSWKNSMQIIETNKGTFIDNLENTTIGGFPMGFDWTKIEGEFLETAGIIYSKNGINFHYIKHPEKIKQWENNNIQVSNEKISDYLNKG